jgi:hypothetical protein
MKYKNSDRFKLCLFKDPISSKIQKSHAYMPPVARSPGVGIKQKANLPGRPLIYTIEPWQ